MSTPDTIQNLLVFLPVLNSSSNPQLTFSLASLWLAAISISASSWGSWGSISLPEILADTHRLDVPQPKQLLCSSCTLLSLCWTVSHAYFAHAAVPVASLSWGNIVHVEFLVGPLGLQHLFHFFFQLSKAVKSLCRAIFTARLTQTSCAARIALQSAEKNCLPAPFLQENRHGMEGKGRETSKGKRNRKRIGNISISISTLHAEQTKCN